MDKIFVYSVLLECQGTRVRELFLLASLYSTHHCMFSIHSGLYSNDAMDCSLPSSSVHRILEWVAYPLSSGFSRPRNWTGVSCIAGGFFTNWTIREALSYHVWSGILVWFVLGISLTLSVVEHLFMCLLAILISFLEKYLFSSPAHFLNQIIWGFVNISWIRD